MRLGEKKYSKDEIYKEFIFGPLKESALNALCIQEEIFENFNEIIKRKAKHSPQNNANLIFPPLSSDQSFYFCPDCSQPLIKQGKILTARPFF